MSSDKNRRLYEQAKDAMAAGNYRKARRLIGQMDHPKREQLLRKVALRQQHAQRQSNGGRRSGGNGTVVAGVVMVVLLFIVGAGAVLVLTRQASDSPASVANAPVLPTLSEVDADGDAPDVQESSATATPAPPTATATLPPTNTPFPTAVPNNTFSNGTLSFTYPGDWREESEITDPQCATPETTCHISLVPVAAGDNYNSAIVVLSVRAPRPVPLQTFMTGAEQGLRAQGYQIFANRSQPFPGYDAAYLRFNDTNGFLFTNVYIADGAAFHAVTLFGFTPPAHDAALETFDQIIATLQLR